MSIQLSLLPREQLHSISQIVNAHLRLVSGIAWQFGNARPEKYICFGVYSKFLQSQYARRTMKKIEKTFNETFSG